MHCLCKREWSWSWNGQQRLFWELFATGTPRYHRPDFTFFDERVMTQIKYKAAVSIEIPWTNPTNHPTNHHGLHQIFLFIYQNYGQARAATTFLKRPPAGGYQWLGSGGRIDSGWMLFDASCLSVSTCSAHTKFSRFVSFSFFELLPRLAWNRRAEPFDHLDWEGIVNLEWIWLECPCRF